MRCVTVALGDEERAGDLRRRQAAEQAQRQRDARLPGQDRVARHEDQAQHVVLHVVDLRDEVGLVELLEDLQLAPDQLLLALERDAAAQRVDAPALGGGHEPGAGVVRDALAPATARARRRARPGPGPRPPPRRGRCGSARRSAGPTRSARRRRSRDGWPTPPRLGLLAASVDLAQLDLHAAVERRALEPLERLLARRALPDPVARDELLRLGERTVDDGALAGRRSGPWRPWRSGAGRRPPA